MKIDRRLSITLLKILDKYPIIALTGPRQSGKTTLLKSLLGDYEYVSLENPDNRFFADNDPNGFLLRYSSKVIIDEAQRVPQLFSYLQTKVDESGEMGQYVLSGSQNFHLMQEITQSLAGRVALFKLFPFDFQEMRNGNLLNKDYLYYLIQGFYPAIYDRGIEANTYYKNYVQTYVQRDVCELIGIKNQNGFKRFLAILATRAGHLLNLNEMAREIGISQPTAKSWLSALENSYIVFTLQPYYENFSKRIVKSPKVYFYDTGLLAHLLKIKDLENLSPNSLKGTLFENMIIAEYVKQNYHSDQSIDFWFWRDSNGNEIDLLFNTGDKLCITEIKSSMTIKPDHFKGLNNFERNAKNKKLIKQLIYGGSENQLRQSGNVISWQDIIV
jgi:predicted AAA+ superfamily ATPase